MRPPSPFLLRRRTARRAAVLAGVGIAGAGAAAALGVGGAGAPETRAGTAAAVPLAASPPTGGPPGAALPGGARVRLATPASAADTTAPWGTRAHHREFAFTRAMYGSGMRMWGRPSWAIDYPKADRQFMVMVDHLMRLDAWDRENAVRLDDPELRLYPFLYALEVGNMRLSQEEVRGLRSYLEAGGFLVVDDFWGSREWAVFEREIRRVLPGRPIEDVPLDHPVFRSFYEIDEILQVPNVGQGVRGGPTWERDGYEPRVRGIFDDDGRLMVVINWNTDLGDAWEHAENPYYPLEYSRFAAEMGVNMIVYGMSH